MFFFFNDTATTEIDTYCHTLSLHDALPILAEVSGAARELKVAIGEARLTIADIGRQTDAIGTRTLSTVNATMPSLQVTAESLDALVRQIPQNPRQTIRQETGKELEFHQRKRTNSRANITLSSYYSSHPPPDPY